MYATTAVATLLVFRKQYRVWNEPVFGVVHPDTEACD